ncbi:hypothetical protein ACLB2K_016296 [Fragaria x ananassa]
MVGSQPTQDMRSAPPMEQILQMFAEIKGRMDGLATQQSVADLTEQVKQNRAFWEFSHNKLTTPGKQIELPSSQSSGEDFRLDKPTSKEEITLSINDDEELGVEAGEIMDNNLISRGVPQKNELEDRTEQSIFEAEIGSRTNDDDEPQVRMKESELDFDYLPSSRSRAPLYKEA